MSAEMVVQVLLVEPCDMVRQVNQLALRAWGTSVCAVKTEDEAVSRLKLRSKLHIARIAAAYLAVLLSCDLSCGLAIGHCSRDCGGAKCM